MATFYLDSRRVYRVRELDHLDWLEHGFGTRAAGEWVNSGVVSLRQVHSAVCHRVTEAPTHPPTGDALLSSTPGLLLAVRTADCLPILIVDERRRAVAAVHAGWRGSAAALSSKAVQAMAEEFGSQPEDLQAAVGPGICGGCYEVGPEVARRFAAWMPQLAEVTSPVHLDLAEVNRLQLVQAGVPPDRIFQGAPCACRGGAEFWSYRRERSEAGRMLSVIGIKRREPAGPRRRPYPSPPGGRRLPGSECTETPREPPPSAWD